jgi:hypothetical protein
VRCDKFLENLANERDRLKSAYGKDVCMLR